MKRLALFAALAATLLAAAPAVAATRVPRAPKLFHGVMWDRAATVAGPEETEDQWALMARSGVESVRTVFSWADTQPTAEGPLDFSAIDAYVGLATRNGVRLLPVVLYTPEWAKRYPGRFGSPPDHASDFAAFTRRLVERYGPGGTYWTEHPELPARPLREWQIWNEPHFDFYWYTPANDTNDWAGQYVALLRQARTAIKAVDPGATIVLAGFADASWRVLSKAYAAGARGQFDVATINIFTGRPGFVIAATRLTRRVLKRYHEARKPIWVTETTFPAARGKVPPPREDWQRRWYTTDAGMAKRLTELYRLGAENSKRLLLRRIYWYTWGSSYRGTDDLFDFSGLVRIDGGVTTQRPALRAYRRSARR
jgi:hypothetical protein